MKKFIKFMRKNFKKILKTVAVIAAVCIGYQVLHNIATAERGYNALGGEIFIFLVPYLIYAIRKNAKDTVEVIKGD